jgi:hypothetical protein
MTTAIASRFSLPVSGRAIVVRHPTGLEDMLLAESAQSDSALALELAARVASAEAGEPLDWRVLSVTDLDAFVLGLRRVLIGNRIMANISCRAENCRTRIDLSFTISEYVAQSRPKAGMPRLRGWTVTSMTDDPGWYRLDGRSADAAGSTAMFRLPSGADQLAVEGLANAAEALARRCVRPEDLPLRLRRPVETAMEALSPSLAGDLVGTCPECGAVLTVHFDPRRFCIQEMRDRARFIYDDIDLLAQRYHWSERAILTLPNPRRARYAELARLSGGA